MKRLAALLLLGIAVTACSSQTGAAAPPTLAAADAEVKFARCMRDNGIGDFPDAIGEAGYAVKDPAAFNKAQDACAKWREAGGQAKKIDAAYVDAVTKFARCMRERGMQVADPDPKTGQYQVKVNDTDRAAFEKAQNACVTHLPR
ncbi:hypothetical protein [Nonomuraea typhae]|uniref:hypothetical protein n=1 Tax=Nonomuraea typhae TaxID=2603600 RepID=UPI0012FB6D4F|nr:hypothetical protein [Nonomuraea typhae]